MQVLPIIIPSMIVCMVSISSGSLPINSFLNISNTERTLSKTSPVTAARGAASPNPQYPSSVSIFKITLSPYSITPNETTTGFLI